MELKNKIIKYDFVKWRDLKWFQPKDLKKMSAPNKEKLKNSLKQNGFATPFNVYKKNNDIIILDGHHRKLVMQELETELKIPEKLPALFYDIKSEKEAQRLFMIINSYYSVFDKEKLANFINLKPIEILDTFKIPDISLNTTFFDVAKKENEIYVKSDVEINIGDIIELGRHKIICGDATNESDVQRVMPEKIDLIYTDPPYDILRPDKFGNNKNRSYDINKVPKYDDWLKNIKRDNYSILVFENWRNTKKLWTAIEKNHKIKSMIYVFTAQKENIYIIILSRG